MHLTYVQACLRVGSEETYRAVLRVLRKRLVRLPTVDPAPDQARSNLGNISLCAATSPIHCYNCNQEQRIISPVK